MEIKRISIIGMGALGVLYGDFFTQKLGKQHVEFVADEKRIEKYKREGVFCNGVQCDFNVVNEEEMGKPADLLVFAVKSTALDSAIKTARNKVSKDTIILSLLNGISSEEIIGQVYGMDKMLYCVAQGMDAVKIGNELKYTQMGKICIGIMDEDEDRKKKLQAVVDLFDRTGLPYTLETDIKHRLWSKFMVNVGVNQAVMIYEGTYATVQRPGEARELMIAAMREVMMLAEKENVKITEKDLDEYVNLIDRMNPNGMPSMRQDGLARRKSEVELFAGTVLALAKKHGISTPVNQKIYDTVRLMESKY
ncbi:MAG TPA: ketopantoate reductase family protein [Clostridiaceae bacterium]|nr:ketopantoate reductase family protein [Clostridiaceae bacterium]